MKHAKKCLVLAVLCIVVSLGFILVCAWQTSSGNERITAFKLTENVARGSLITENMVEETTVGAYGMSDTVSDKAALTHKYAAADMAKGQLIFEGNITDNSTGGLKNLERLDGSKVAYSISSGSLAASVSGKLLSGDIVSVYVSTKEGASVLPPALTYVVIVNASTARNKIDDCGKLSSCENKCNCAQSAYGRMIYIKPVWDLRLFTKIPRGSKLWKEKMNLRTSIERLNNRILNHYGVQHIHIRSRKRISFFTMLAGFNIHLDAGLALLKAQGSFSFNQFFKASCAT